MIQNGHFFISNLESIVFLGASTKFKELLAIKGHKFVLKQQVDYLGRYNPRLDTKIDGWIDWNMNSYHLVDFINAFDEPYMAQAQ